MTRLAEPPGPPGPRPSVVCLPHAGGRAASFDRWARGLRDLADVVPVDRPGRHSRRDEPVVHDPDAIVADLVRACRAREPAPLVLFGHSMGAWLAYETAARLERDGTAVGGVLVSALAAPEHLAARPPRERFDDEALLEQLQRWGGVTPDLVAPGSTRESVLAPLRADLVTTEHRSDSGWVLSAPLFALAGSEDPTAPPAQVAGWAARSADWRGLSIVPGGHFFHVAQEDLVLRVLRAALISGILDPHGPRRKASTP